MADDAVCSPSDEVLSPNPDVELTMDDEESHMNDGASVEFGMSQLEHVQDLSVTEKSNNLDPISSDLVRNNKRVDPVNEGDQVLEIDRVDLVKGSENLFELTNNGHSNNADQIIDVTGNNDDGNGPTKANLEPVEGMEFYSYDDAYKYYNCYAKQLGFGIRVKSSWTKRNSKEKRGAVLCCSCEGFKAIKEGSNNRRKETTRTGCEAMIRLRMLESNMWRLDEVRLGHNHSFDRENARSSRSHKTIESGNKRSFGSIADVQVQTIKLYRTSLTCTRESSNTREPSKDLEPSNRLKLAKHEVRLLCDYFCEQQLLDPNFFYVMDLNDDGFLKNVFWVDSRSRASYKYFGDVVLIVRNVLSLDHEKSALVVSFVGSNHHVQPLLLGCSLLADETLEAYTWLMRTWLTCMFGHAPQTLITYRCESLQCAVSEVVPRARHCLYLPLVMKSIYENLERNENPEIFRKMIEKIVYDSMKAEDFESGWAQMIRHFPVHDREWAESLYNERDKWVPAYLKDVSFAGMLQSEFRNTPFDAYARAHETVDGFLHAYEAFREEQIEREDLEDSETRSFGPALITGSSYELQLSQSYTKEIFLKSQQEVSLMSNCYSIAQIHVNGSITTYMVRERDIERDFEVEYNKDSTEVRCVCSCFGFRGYLCRHALSVLNFLGLEQIPSLYVLSRWRKDVKRVYVPDLGSEMIDVNNPVQRFDHLYKRAVRVVLEGMRSEERCVVAMRGFEESIDGIRSVGD